MHRAGTITRIAGGVLIARSDDDAIPEIGDEAVDEQLEPVGQIVDVFGPVHRPYLAITPAPERRPTTVLGETVYVRE